MDIIGIIILSSDNSDSTILSNDRGLITSET